MEAIEIIRNHGLNKDYLNLKKYLNEMEPDALMQLMYAPLFDGLPFLYYSMINKDFFTLECLIEDLQLSVNKSYFYKRRSCKPLIFAITYCPLSIVQYIVFKGALLDDDSNGVSPLIKAYNANREVFLWLIEVGGTNINGTDDKGNTCLFLALQQEKYDLAEYLIGKGADINHCNQDGENILHLVAEFHNSPFLYYAVKNDIAYRPNNQGLTPIIKAALRGNYRALYEFYKKSLASLKDFIEAVKIFSVNPFLNNHVSLHFKNVEYLVLTENLSLELNPEQKAKGSPFFSSLFQQSEYENFTEYQNCIENKLNFLNGKYPNILFQQYLIILERVLGFENDYFQQLIISKLFQFGAQKYKQFQLISIFFEANVKKYGLVHPKTIQRLSLMIFQLEELYFNNPNLMELFSKVVEQTENLHQMKAPFFQPSSNPLGWKKLSEFAVDLWLSYKQENWKFSFHKKEKKLFESYYRRFIKGIASISDSDIMLHAWKYLNNNMPFLFHFISNFDLNINTRLPNNENLLHKAIKEQRPAPLVEQLLKAGCYPYRHNDNGETPESIAKHHGYSTLFPPQVHTLQCISAQVVCKNVSYEQLLPKALSKFVSMH